MTDQAFAPTSGAADRALRVALGALVYVLPVAVLVLLDGPALAKPAWSDEWATWLFSAQSWSGLWHSTSHVDRDLLPYYALAHLLRGWGAGMTTLRVIAFAAGIVSVVASQLVARRIWGRIAALVTGLALAGNPFFCLWVTEARPTAFAYAAVPVTTLLALRWSRRDAIAYPLVMTVATLLFPPTALVMGPHVFWRWRADGWRAALRFLVPAAAGVLLVASWEALWWRQVPALVVASKYGIDNVFGAVSHPLGAERGLPWLHAAAVAAGLLILATHRAPRGVIERRGIALALLMVEGTLAAQWGATALGVPMLADNLLACVPTGAALLLGGLIGYAWFASPSPDVDTSVAFRGAFATATALIVILASAWWADNARSDISADRMELVAPALAARVQVGDLVLFQQPYFSVGYTYSLAAALGDRDLEDALRERLPEGAKTVETRRVATVDADHGRLTTTAALPLRAAHRVWVVRLPAAPTDPLFRSALSCSEPKLSETPVLLVYLDLYTCS